VYQGTESHSDTIAIFRNAALIVGFHGAGFANALFSRRQPVYVYEWSTYQNVNNTVPWRANSPELVKWMGGQLPGQMISRVERFPIQQLGFSNGTISHHPDIDHLIKDQKWIRLTTEDIDRVAAFAKSISGITSLDPSFFPERPEHSQYVRPQSCEQKSTSQSGEEEAMIQHFFRNKTDGQYVEMGALDGVRFSNTLKLHKCLNWNGLLIEGLGANFAELKNNVAKHRPRA